MTENMGMTERDKFIRSVENAGAEYIEKLHNGKHLILDENKEFISSLTEDTAHFEEKLEICKAPDVLGLEELEE